MGSPKTKHKHIHQFHLVRGIWRCALPNCVWFMYDSDHAHGILSGRATQCNHCSAKFLIDEQMLFDARGKMDYTPICDDCKEKQSHPPVVESTDESISLEERMRLLGLQPGILNH